jgi:2-polyprenyl-6-methoxyphenol hydroxylase-like FAD-dependent oxidoreductase
MAKSVDALIIGTGPTGLTHGLGLLHQGKSVVIAEKHLQGLSFSCAILVMLTR